MTRILALTNFYPPHAVGGERSAADVLDRLARRGHEVTVLTSDWRGEPAGSAPREQADSVEERSQEHRKETADDTGGVPAADPVTGGVEVIRSLRFYWWDHAVVVPGRWSRLVREMHNRSVLREALRKARPEVVCIWTMGALSMGLVDLLSAARLPLVYAVCNDWLVWGPDQDAWMHGWSDRPGLAKLARLVTGLPTSLPDVGASGTFLFVSEWTRRYAGEHSRWAFPDSAVVYSGIEAGELQAPSDPDRPWGWRLLFVGRLDRDKGADVAVNALRHLPDEATLSVIGPGSVAQRAELEDLAEAAGLSGRVFFGARPRSELASQYAAADVFLFPSRWEEPFGLTPLEAMACGTPVVATGMGGSSEYLADGRNCLLVPRDDPAAMAAAVRRLATDPTLRRAVVDAGRRTAAGLTTDQLADVFEQWLVGAATGFRAGRPGDRALLV